jgi:hypothetical protein
MASAWLATAAVAASAAEKAKDPGSAAPKSVTPAPATGSSQDLSGSQQKLATEFSDLESVLMRMRDLIRPTDPNRAALIEKALKESGDRRVASDFQEIVELLRNPEKLSSATRMQGKVSEDLEAILQLLLSEESAKRLKDRQAEYRKYLARLNNIIKDQGDVRGRNLSGEDPKPLSVEQGALAQRTGGLSKDIGKNEEKDRGNAKDDKNSDKNKDGKNNDGKNNDGKTQPGDNKSSDGKSQSGDSKSSDKSGKDGNKSDKSSKSGKNDKTDPKSGKNDKSNGKEDKNDKTKPDADDKSQKGDDDKSDKSNDDKSQQGNDSKSQQGKGQQSKSQQGKGQQSKSQGQQGQQQDQDQDPDQQQAQNQNNQQQQEQNPVRKRLQAAQEHMKQAEDRLKKAQKDGAADEQEKALEELKTAKAELEEILRQMREEEMKQLLASLIARMQKVLIVQREIYDGTMRLDKVPVAQRSHGHEIESGHLSSRERSIVHDVSDALRLLHEEGTAVAMPEALNQVHDDMEQIEQRLGQGKTEVLTQAIETDVIKELEEIIDAFKKAKERAESKKKPPGPTPSGEPQDPPLIEKIAELKMIKALQLRVNRRTERYAKLIEPGREQTNKDDVFEALQKLADQQKRVYKVTRDLDLGKNE